MENQILSPVEIALNTVA